ncbi:MAG: hypothetical protein MSS94_08270, partial [Clostridiales bacterium]|nr:hypothetical protein [Clostridiales bacterium]
MKRNPLQKTGLALLVCIAMFACLLAGVPARAEELPKETESVNTVQVSTVDEFLAAIAPNTEIVLAPGEYNLTQAAGYGRTGGKYYHWESTFDGCELVIT